MFVHKIFLISSLLICVQTESRCLEGWTATNIDNQWVVQAAHHTTSEINRLFDGPFRVLGKIKKACVADQVNYAVSFVLGYTTCDRRERKYSSAKCPIIQIRMCEDVLLRYYPSGTKAPTLNVTQFSGCK
ncbi:uncharacterized protein LOC141852373 [Brevipalpus obovatus]|uniref:uncharacterized protein LOC141852373 n=1 Tax=Brevipalpus obovatus TaxID=246614 RepID=UPI003D9DDE7D